MGYRVVLTTDRTLTSLYRNIPLLDFLGCAPAETLPEVVFNVLAPQIGSPTGVLTYAPYGLRKVEAALLRDYRKDEIVVAHPDRVEHFISDNTKIVGIYTMDPLGLGPLSLSFSMGMFTSYSKKYFVDLVKKLRIVRKLKKLKFKIVVGGPGAWYLEVRPKERERLEIDHVVIGEADHVAPFLFREIENDRMPTYVKVSRGPRLDDIPKIVAPSIGGLVEVMRGCGRNCEFCDPNLRLARYQPIDYILDEIKLNVKYGNTHAWVHSEDIFLYDLKDKKNFMPNRESLIELFRSIMSLPGVTGMNPTHGTVAPAAADPELIRQLSKIMRAGPNNYIGIQTGLETGSGKLLWNYMPLKMKPFGPDEWAEVVVYGTAVLNANYWFPAYTLIIGLPGETEEDAWDTLALLDAMEKQIPEIAGASRAHFTVTPLYFVPMGVLKGEEFFDPLSLNEGQLMVVYRAWRHILLELERIPLSLFDSLTNKIGMWFMSKIAARLILKYIERMALKFGYDLSKAFRVKGEKINVGKVAPLPKVS